MSLSLVATKAFALKLKIHCNACEKKLKQMLLKVQGVHTVRVDAKQGHVLITGTVDPPTILSMLEKLGRKAELLWEQGPPVSSPTGRGKDGEIVTRSSKGITPLNYQDIMENMEELSAVPGLQSVEVINTIKFSFKNGSVAEITSTRNDVQRSQHHHGLCAVSSSCSGGHAVNRAHGPHGCCCFHGNGYLGSFGMHSQNNCCHWQSPRVAFGCNVSPPGPAPPWEYGIPSAPPMPPSDYEPSARSAPPPPPQPAPVRANAYPSMFSDENPESLKDPKLEFWFKCSGAQLPTIQYFHQFIKQRD